MNKYIYIAVLLSVFSIYKVSCQDLSKGYIANDLTQRPMKPLAKPGYLESVTDPSFPGTTIRRISEAELGRTIGPMYSTIQSWNADESLMIVYAVGSGHILLDGTDYSFIRNLSDIRPDDIEDVFWHFTDPDILFYLDSRTDDLIRYNVRSQSHTTLVNLREVSGCDSSSGITSGSDVQMMSWDSDVFTFRCGNSSAYYYRISTNVLTEFNIPDINYRAPMPFPSGNLFYHNTSVYDANGNFVRDLNIEKGEHSCLGKLSNGDDAYFAIAFAQGPDGGCLGTLVAHNATTGNCFAVTPTEDYGYSKSGTHISAVAHKNSEGGWVAVSSIGSEKDGVSVLDQELFLAKVDEFEGTVYRVAHHRSDEDDIDYWGEPHVSISPSGTRLLFRSDWSGLDDGESVDAYVAELSAYDAPTNESSTPLANAGEHQTITLPINSVILSGSGSDPDGGDVSYSWEMRSGPNTPEFSNIAQASATASNFIEGSYTFRLTVTDDENETASDEVQITVLPDEVSFEIPIANAGEDQTITLPNNVVTLNGSGSDPDGGEVSFIWEMQSGPNTPEFSNIAQASATTSNFIEGSYTIRLTVTDDENESASDEVQITVLPDEVSFEIPIANAGEDQTITLPNNSVTLSGSGSDPDGGEVSYSWQLQSGPNVPSLSSADQTSATASNLVAGAYSFQVTVTDDESQTATDDVSVLVLPEETTSNFAIRINAGGGQSTYNGATFDADKNFDTGTIVNRPQTGLPQPYSSIRYSPTQVMSYDIPVPNGEYTVRLHFAEVWFGATGGGEAGEGRRVFDVKLEGQLVEDNLDIFAEVGAETIVVKTHTVNVTGGVLDIDFSALAADGGTRHPVISAIEILGNVASSKTPLVNAGQDATITLPSSRVVLNGRGSDPDGGAVSFLWSQQSGPNTALLTNSDSESLTASNLVEGVYNFLLKVTDDENETATDNVIIRVLPSDDNTSIFALRINAGGGQTTYSGDTFEADQYFDAGTTLNRPQTGLLQPHSSIRYSRSQKMSYDIPVPNGEYTIRLHFAEVWFGATGGGAGGVGNRVFDVQIEGQLAEDNLDIFSEVGADAMLLKTHTVNVTGGVLDIDFSSLAVDGGTRHPIINAIEIIEIVSERAVTAKNDSSNTMKVYSSHGSTIVTATLEEPTEVKQIFVFDMIGRLLKSYKANEIRNGEGFAIDVKYYEQGAYIIKMLDDKGVSFQKQMLVKQL